MTIMLTTHYMFIEADELDRLAISRRGRRFHGHPLLHEGACNDSMGSEIEAREMGEAQRKSWPTCPACRRYPWSSWKGGS